MKLNLKKMKKGTLIKLKDGLYKLFCIDEEYFVFGKITKMKNGGIKMNMNKTAVFSSLPEFHEQLEKHIVNAN